ncbi:MAG: class I poly(R)-hydroxyalkanoic acid synthase [Candidatus Pacebacteria bacterium]|nr:class I poly(R)-hydroxyalkanoic acid synthase [Candidatus Paceibacterota bacterium]
MHIAEQSQKLVADFLQRQQSSFETKPNELGAYSPKPGIGMGDPLNIGKAFMEMAGQMMSDPSKVVEAQFALWQDYMQLWQNTTQRMMGAEVGDLVAPTKEDKRFKDAAWNENLIFDYIKQSYLLTARWLKANVQSVEGLDDKTARKVEFYTRQFVDAMAPSNFVMTNPEVLRATVESGGENLLKGLKNLLDDLEKGKGQLSISMTDDAAFGLGKNLAMTPGKVIFQNRLIQLIQYDPATEKVHRTPIMIIPPWINKYYILDLQAKNSMVKWMVDQGYTVFMISWINPDNSLAQTEFEDYMFEGTLAAMTAVAEATDEGQIQIMGYCLGGTLLSCTLAYLEELAKSKQKPAKPVGKLPRVEAVTFLTTMIDFAESGELSVFIDEEQLTSLEERMNRDGYLEGSDMAKTFNLLRANDLIWSFVVNNYLLGKDPFPFDLLYWNSDSTRMPAKMHSFYLRKMYQSNLLRQPGGISLGGVPIDLGLIKTPSLFVSTKEDHIAPWKSTYIGTQLLGRKPEFILASSGHIAGVVNPPAAKKYMHWINSDLPVDSESWFNSAKPVEGSWWPEWDRFSTSHGGEMVPARTPGSGKLKALEDAPGSFVKVKS